MTLEGTVQVNSEDIGAIAVLQNHLYSCFTFLRDDDQELFWDWAREKGIRLFI